jgi:hypothetical protein
MHTQVAGERLRDRAYLPKWDASRKGNDVVLVNNDTTVYRVDKRGWCVSMCAFVHVCMHACVRACVCACLRVPTSTLTLKNKDETLNLNRVRILT